MDENEKMDPSIIKGLFEQGVCLFRATVVEIFNVFFYLAHGY